MDYVESSVRSEHRRPRLQCEGERSPSTRECCSLEICEVPCAKANSTTRSSAFSSTTKTRCMKRRSRFGSSSLVMFSILVVLSMFGSSAGGEEPSISVPSSSAKAGEWQECLVSPEDAWVPASHDSLTAIIQREYDRRYTCVTREGAKLAARYAFDSKCTERSFSRETVNSCLKGRRIIFLGDSLSTQQGDSLLGMLGWHPDWLEKGHPKSSKFVIDADGAQRPALYECYRQSRDPSTRCERCYDVFELSVPKSYKQSDAAHTAKLSPHLENGRVVDPNKHTRKLQRVQGVDSSRFMGQNVDPSTTAHDGTQRYADGDGTQRDVRWLGEAGPGERQGYIQQNSRQETSVHVRMFSIPGSAAWVRRTLADFNETRPSDIYVVNFGAHYHEDPGGEDLFRSEVSLLLDDIAEIADSATVVWREYSPVHFPSANGSYDNMLGGSDRQGALCCTGTPPPVHPRNEWVEKYLSDNGLADKIKILRIYQMSRFRAAAHRTCHLGAPQSPWSTDADPHIICPSTGLKLDCRHWSEPGVVNEWNKLMLNHLCPAE